MGHSCRWVTVAWKRAVSDLQVAFCGKTCAAWQTPYFKPFHELGMIGFYIDWICSPTGYDWKIPPKSFQWGVDMIIEFLRHFGRSKNTIWGGHSLGKSCLLAISWHKVKSSNRLAQVTKVVERLAVEEGAVLMLYITQGSCHQSQYIT